MAEWGFLVRQATSSGLTYSTNYNLLLQHSFFRKIFMFTLEMFVYFETERFKVYLATHHKMWSILFWQERKLMLAAFILRLQTQRTLLIFKKNGRTYIIAWWHFKTISLELHVFRNVQVLSVVRIWHLKDKPNKALTFLDFFCDENKTHQICKVRVLSGVHLDKLRRKVVS